jgi:hypothetical protein
MKVMGLNMLDLMAYGTWNPEAKVERKDQLEVVVMSFCRFWGHVYLEMQPVSLRELEFWKG